MFRVGMIDRYSFQDQYLTRGDVINYDKTIMPLAHPVIGLHPHNDTPEKPSTIIVSLFLSTLDRENAAFILSHAKEINEMLGTYSTIPIRFDSTILLEDIMKRQSLHLKCEINTRTGSISTACLDEDPVGQLFFAYMKHFEAIQHLITIFNTFIAKAPAQKIRHLNNTFAIIGCYRKLGNLNPYYDLHYRYGSDVLQTIDEDKNFFSQANMPIGFEMLKKKLAKAYHHLCPTGDRPSEEVLHGTPEYIAINALLKEYTGFKLGLYRPEYEQSRYTFYLEDSA